MENTTLPRTTPPEASPAPPFSLLRMGAGARLGLAAALSALVWGALWWALS